MASILPMDELNRLEEDLRHRFGDSTIEPSRSDEEDVIDELLDLFLLTYSFSVNVTNENLASDWTPSLDEVMETVDEQVAGETWRERVRDYYLNGGTGADIARIADTEMHRIANTAALKTAQRAGAKTKTWATMLDDRVRETHDYLEGMTVGINEDFYTFDGDHAPAPGGFALAENNVNCRCELLFE